ncbi:hypothetical protein G6O69_06345 [Pseudenhygromyxa sp. WMMC2535]|uniref:hypothetical protein n=1 Tax=Pseudenhygromyxa sp. WMMC2535 TaxID=2712867 RepID=UPI0015533560|nr:hypothetical protein [Pseudenhygromyxa sp. WMMC2535]NVB37444.1 hypothetical protein [Pseudenhygromyxa sp. WMMC2535]
MPDPANNLLLDDERSFGTGEPSHALCLDEPVRQFLVADPAGVNLGEGVEGQRSRVTVPDALWFSVDISAIPFWADGKRGL